MENHEIETQTNKPQKAKKVITSLVMVGAMAVTCGLTGCFGNDGNTPGTNPGNTPTTEYSLLITNILESDYYNSILDAGTTNLAHADPHPYGFLEDQGYDVASIKNGTLKCNTKSFIKEDEPNNLYIMTNVETKTSNPYYTEYMIKYSLTDKEIADYKFLYEDKYIQSLFVNDVISQYKTAEIVSEAKVSVELHDYLLEKVVYKSTPLKTAVNSSEPNFILSHFTEPNFCVYMYAYGDQAETYDIVSNTKLVLVKLVSTSHKLDVNNNILEGYMSPYNIQSSSLTETTNIKLYDNQTFYIHLNRLEKEDK